MVARFGPRGSRYPKIPGYTPRFRLGGDEPYIYIPDDPEGEQREVPDYDTWDGEWEVET